MVKARKELFHEEIYKLIKNVWEQKKLPIDWLKEGIYPLYKKRDKQLSENYKSITLLETVDKLVAQNIRIKLNTYYVENIKEKYQNDNWKGAISKEFGVS